MVVFYVRDIPREGGFQTLAIDIDRHAPIELLTDRARTQAKQKVECYLKMALERERRLLLPPEERDGWS